MNDKPDLIEFMETIEPYVEDGYWFGEDYEEAIHLFLHKNFGELFSREVQIQDGEA
jgi:hypothetical protein